ncbi:pleckstrin homology domain-containing family A member 4-like isoform X2 [Ambystoma mexicanum]|uniref:pleckstrin homology domain-containing family A member 4-like isoform X2 n=1 Tax=Ambystoma mexicanum TaxID=8296 RepID=UPI0037E76BEF
MSELERPRSGLSVASSVATISSVNLGSKPTRSVKRVHTFGKREYAIKRDPNSAVEIRGWLYKQDSAGLRLWKRRWFVLSDFCLFYYRDSREETVLGSILLPSYEILPAGPREAKNRKFTFKAEHPGMRTYYFGADTQEDMNGWIRAMNHSALVVADNNNKMGHLNNLANSAQDGLYTSYEDFTRSTLTQNGEHAKSAESLEIAHLSDTRSQQNSSSDSLLGPDRGGDGEGKGGTFAGPRDPTSSSSEDVDQFSTLPQHGSAPPSTPVCGVKKVDFTYDLLSSGSERLVQRKESISQVEEWVCLQKEKLMVKEFQESFGPRTPSGQVPKGFENPREGYPASPVVSHAPVVSPSSPLTNRQAAVLPEPETYDVSMAEGGWERKGEGQATSWPESPHPSHSRLQSTPSGFSHNTRTAASPPTERAGHTSQASIRASRSYSLPPTPSELSRPRAPLGSSTPDDNAYANTSGGRPAYYAVAPQVQKSRAAGPHSQRDLPETPRQNHQDKMTQGKLHASSCEELNLIGSSSPSSKTLARPHTPMGRVDMHPLEDAAGIHAPTPRHPKEKPSEAYATGARNRGHLMRSSSRPLTPADRYDVLPSDATYCTVSMARSHGQAIRHPRMPQHPGQEDERLGDGYSVILAPRMHGPSSSRLQYSDRTFMASPAFVPRTHNSTPRLHNKMVSHPSPANPGYAQLPPLPQFSSRSASHVMPGKRISLAVPPHSSGMYRERMPRPVRVAENDTDILLTKLCGQDKLLQSLEEESLRLRTDKEKLENVLEVTRLNMAEFEGQEDVLEKIWYQQRMLQDDLVHVRARLCDLTLEKGRAWEDYRVLENDLHGLRETLEHVRHVGHPQDQAAAQRDLWMINDIISGLRVNKSSVYVTPEPTRHPALMLAASPATDQHPGYQQGFQHLSGLQQEVEVTPPRPPLPKDHTTATTETEGQMNGNNNNQVPQEFSSKHAASEGANPAGQRLLEHSPGSAFTTSVSVHEADLSSPTRGPAASSLSQGSGPASHPGAIYMETKASPPRNSEGGSNRKQRMSTEEQMQRMRRHQEAQIHERMKPGPTLHRQGSQKNTTSNGGGQFPSQLKGTFVHCDESGGAASPMKTMVSARSPGMSPRGLDLQPDEDYSIAPEGQRDRIVNLSYTLATEASQRSKLMTAKALADEYSDDSVPEEAEDWDFLLQEVYSSPQLNSSATHPQTLCHGTSGQHRGTDEPGNRVVSRYYNQSRPPSDRTACHLESSNNQSQHLENTDVSDSAASQTDRRPHENDMVECYENWTVHEHRETTEKDRVTCLNQEQVPSLMPGCNGRVANCGYQLERVDFSKANLDQVVGYLKEGEEAIRVTVLQSSF